MLAQDLSMLIKLLLWMQVASAVINITLFLLLKENDKEINRLDRKLYRTERSLTDQIKNNRERIRRK